MKSRSLGRNRDPSCDSLPCTLRCEKDLGRYAQPGYAHRAHEAGRCGDAVGSELILSGFRSPTLKWERKSDGSVVTPFDLESERRIRTFLETEQAHPWPVLGEELGGDAGGARYHWIVDPIDGTLPFSRGLASFGTLLALEDTLTQRAIVGVVNLPALGETYSAARGAGAGAATNGSRSHHLERSRIASYPHPLSAIHR